MISLRAWARASLAGLVLALASASAPAAEPGTAGKGATGAESGIDFARDVRPILSGYCFKCHGPDPKARKAELRLDLREEAIKADKNGKHPIVPGKPEASELARRIATDNEDDVMPPPEAKHPLTAPQKETLKRWIAAGAEYRPHWAFVPPTQAPLPKVKKSHWPRNEIDYFILARLEQAGLEPSAPADKYTLVRRVYLDLIGLPPTPAQADAFVNDRSPRAYEKLVDDLLASPHYGERWARRWLDLARYADTNGYEKDRKRSIWPYRDWVINALNADLPFDQFTVEQLAGDMLPNATLPERIATGFHRNTMLNEEGGIDPQEYRFYAMVDRANTTATTWLGLTMGCAQCHTHKFDPILHQEYYQFQAFLDNADEPEIDVPTPEIAQRRTELEAKIAALTAKLPEQFPPEEISWRTPVPLSVRSAGGATTERLPDGSIRFGGTNSATDTYSFEFAGAAEAFTAAQLEVFADPDLPRNGPGRSADGDAALSEIKVSVNSAGATNSAQTVKVASAQSNYSTDDQPVTRAIDGKNDTGWLLKRSNRARTIRVATFKLEPPSGVGTNAGARWTIALVQEAGQQRTLGRVRLSLGTPVHDERPVEVRRREHLDKKFNAWLEQQTARAVRWTTLRPTLAKSNLPLLTILDDATVLASGDQTKRDVYDLAFATNLVGVTAIRLDALADERLPKHGPGRTYYEGPFGDFNLSEITVTADGQPAPLKRATQDFANGAATAEAAIDGDPQTGWSIDGGQGEAHAAVFTFAEPLVNVKSLAVKLLFEKYYPADLGRFRISVTTAAGLVEAPEVPPEIEALLARSTPRTPEEQQTLLRYFATQAPELAEARRAIEKARRELPAFPTTLVMTERPPDNPRKTYLHQRGEFLRPAEQVAPGVPSFLPPLASDEPPNRLGLARWLTDPRNPLTGRVVVNRQWAAFFGAGIVRTLQDFGYQGDLPSHPELLDWLAVHWVKDGWSMKRLHRLIVMSATYQQASRVTPQLLEKDPQNRLLSRGPRVRLEAELIRDLALSSSGLYAPKVGGPSVFPPQPPGVSTEGAYGPLEWKVSAGADRYRRGLYTFSKRTAPYAMFTTFDGPTGEACIARREVSDTPLQSLTVLNDAVFVEAAQALGKVAVAAAPGDAARAALLFRRCLTRPPAPAELTELIHFCQTQRQRFQEKELDAAVIAGDGEGDVIERATWTAAARALLNLDETITKE